MRVYSRNFQNELGNAVTVRAREEKISGIDGIIVSLVGSDSDTEFEVTRQEALEVLEAISRALNLPRR